MTQKVHLFAGPSTVGIDPALYADLNLYRPIRRDELRALTERETQPGVVVIADGIFHHYPSVGHAEIRHALSRGWTVWGVSSMGAIRAAEMMHLGMQGFGAVFERYAEDADFTDDEVALLHMPEHPYIPVTEPLVNIRRFLDALKAGGSIAPSAAVSVISELQDIWFGYRTLKKVRSLLGTISGLDIEEIKATSAEFGKFRVKNHDLAQLLESRPWQH